MLQQAVRLRIVVIAFAAIVASVAYGAGEPKRVAVLADGMALGEGTEAHINAWPLQLGRMLGREWLARGFARGGASLDPASKRFVMSLPEWTALTKFEPDIVVVALGAGDVVDPTFESRERVPKGLDQVLVALAALPKKPVVHLAFPPPPGEGWRRAASYELASKDLIVMIQEAAQRHGATTIDTRTPLVGQEKHLVQGYMPDNEAGRTLATTVCKALTGREAAPEVGLYRRTPVPTGLVSESAVLAGAPLRLRGAEHWATKDGALENGEGAQVLVVPMDVGTGDFRLRANFVFTGGEGHGPALGFDGNWILLEDDKGNVRGDGEVFRGRPFVGRSNELAKRGESIDFEIRRVGGDLEVIANGKLLISAPAVGMRFTRFALAPQGAKVRVKDMSIETEKKQAPLESESSPPNPSAAPKP